MLGMLKNIHKEIINILAAHNASYSDPLSSGEIAKVLSVNPSYLRLQILLLKKIVGVRRGKKGGYFLKKEVKLWLQSRQSSN